MLTGTDPSLAHQQSEDPDCARIWNEPDRVVHLEPEPLAGFLDCILPLSQLILAKDWATASEQKYQDRGDGLIDMGAYVFMASGDVWWDWEDSFGRPRDWWIALYPVSHFILSHCLIPQNTYSIFPISWCQSVFPWLHVDARNCVNLHSSIVSDNLSLILGSSNQHRTFSKIPLLMLSEVWWSVYDELPPCKHCHFTTMIYLVGSYQ